MFIVHWRIDGYSKGWMTFSPAVILSVEQDRGCANPFCKTVRQKSFPEISVLGGQTVHTPEFNVLQIEFKISPTTQFWVFFQWSRQIMTGKQKAARLSPPKLSGSNKQTTNKIKLNWTNARFLDLNLWRKKKNWTFNLILVAGALSARSLGRRWLWGAWCPLGGRRSCSRDSPSPLGGASWGCWGRGHSAHTSCHHGPRGELKALLTLLPKL